MGFVSVAGHEPVRSAPEKNATPRNTSARVQARAIDMAPPKLNPEAKIRLSSMHRSPSSCARMASVSSTSDLLQEPAPLAASGAAKIVLLLSKVASVK